MRPNCLTRDQEITLVGPAMRTSAATAAADIAAFWQQFMEQDWPSRIPLQPGDGAIYAAYCEYESDHRGAYTMLLGVHAPAGTQIEGLRTITVPPGRYARFVAQGHPSQALWQAWSHINEAWEMRGERCYAVDMERYEPGAFTLDGVTAEVLVGIR